MYPHLAYVFIDGGYLRVLAKKRSLQPVNPLKLAKGLVESPLVQTWAYNPITHPNALLGRITYYDGLPDDGEKSELDPYWRAVERLQDVHLGFGALRGLKRHIRQKGVDTLIAVDVLVGAFAGIFDIAVLVAGDSDFVPVVEEVKRRGVMVAIAAETASLADDLSRVADRFIEIPNPSSWLEPMSFTG